MPLQFTVFASGSSGNASLLQADGFGLLLDVGMGPRQLAKRLTAVQSSWRQVHAAILSHTHSDHWKDRTLAQLYRLRIPLYCHADHRAALSSYSSVFDAMRAEKLVRTYEPDQELVLSPALRCRPLRLRHDCGVTCGFRFEGSADFFGQPWALGYVADLGTWDQDLAGALGDVDLLALEFNHDVAMERSSGRSPRLIARVLGDYGHLSNAQAAALLREVVQRSAPGRLRHVIQLHLSRDCNCPDLAAQTARTALDGLPTPVAVHTASQHTPSPTFHLGGGMTNGVSPRSARQPRKKRPRAASSLQPWLPGMEGEKDAC